MLLYVLLGSLATALLLGWLTAVLPRSSDEPRVPKALAAVLAAAPLAGSRVWSRRGERDADEAAVPEDDVELAIRERLYGRRRDPR